MEDEWIKVGNVADIDEDDTHSVEIDGKQVCLYNLGGEIFATDGTCTHGDADLSLGMVLDSCLIECPLHEGTFDIRSGRAVDAPCTEPLHCYPVKVEQGVIFLRPVR
ncbi:MAG: non-heme iron oxygenase ferredoxin subunit [Hydrogenophaga sp.]|nr:non-heme iron oxygenase ferredoxin subunit [Hydrogenophaga sp.]